MGSVRWANIIVPGEFMPVAFGYTIFYVSDVTATLRFFTDAFGIEKRFVTPEGDYGELETGSTALAFASLPLAHANLDEAGGFQEPTPTTAPFAASITLTTPDVAETLAAALRAGASLYVEPVAKPWGQTVAYLRDPDGILIEIATPMAP
jgi:lactoylglutathione lyase